MNTKLRVEYDFNKKEPYLELSLDVQRDQSVTMPDKMLREFSSIADNVPIIFIKREHSSNTYEIRAVDSDIDITYQENILLKFAEWSKSYFYNGVDGELAKELGETYSKFFNQLYGKISPRLLPSKKMVLNYNTLRHYFETRLPQDARIKAFNNTPRDKWDEDFETFTDGMAQAFDHAKSPEGIKYWSDVISNAINKNNS